ncbi:N-acetylmuramoyl-L-alanine amidase LytC precursor [Dermatophilus congolensis]|uniref:N-acetylmuramoyl-L-alanine amidase LytC n=1 Tax=Dermatophilus congolensis TaxID=1863 RepID=A0AA46BLE4_9MICO|nr:cell wall-binding repeat-containing protein [Dermatophilus congolensis]STD03700.1 N-acetylmuramoyl-L-alanine amidase LytC precursor [Dermatophilus congolensis]
MNSAAKLRTRGIAAFGATVLVATAFGPAAMAWDATPTAPNAAKAASFGLVDADRSVANTQGATALSAGMNNQTVGDMRFVVPATWKKGDKLVFTLKQPAGADTDIAKRISFSSQPAIDVESKAYAETTHISATSPGTSAAPDSTVGSVESGTAAAYQVPSGGVAPVAPQFTVAMGSSSNNSAYQDEIILTMNNTNDVSAANAKFIGTITGAKVNVGAKAPSAAVTVEASAKDSADVSKAIFWDATTTAAVDKSTTAPAVISNGSLTVSNSSVVADGSAQMVGPISLSRTDAALTGTPKVTLTGDAIVDNPTAVKVKQYGKDGSLITPSGGDLGISESGADVKSMTVSGALDAATYRIEFVGAALKVPTTVKSIKFDLDPANNGGVTLPTLAAATYNQTDIQDPAGLLSVTIRPSQPAVDARVAGFDRYSTASKLAETVGDKLTGMVENENVVLASGENYADALSAGYLARTKNAAVILTNSKTLPGATVDFMRTHGVKNVYIVGGTNAVSSAIEKQISDTKATDVVDKDGAAEAEKATLETLTQTINVVRISGENRFVTNRNVNRYAYETSNGNLGSMAPTYGQPMKRTAIFVDGLTPWDALAAGPLVAGRGGAMPIILTHGNKLEGQAAGQIGDFNLQNAIIVGGTSVIPTSVESDMAAHSVTNVRLAGADRWATGKAVNDFLLKAVDVTATSGVPGLGFTNTTSPFLVNGGTIAGKPDATKWADALAIGPAAAAERRVLALTDSATLPTATSDFLKAHPTMGAVTAVGGTDVVSQKVIEAANALLGK